ncbi:MAG TPA: hypothetical protein VH877_12820 [Polyangia bacterium]|nr:hypothetical protein [Polyangia bacterium]
MRLLIFLFLIMVGLLWGGGQGLYTVFANRAPTTMSIAEYTRTRPSGKWLRLTDCSLSLLDAMHREVAQKPVELFIPARDPGDDEKSKVQVLVATKDPALLEVYRRLSSEKDEKAVETISAEFGKVFQHRDVQGLVRFGFDLDEEDREKLASLTASLAPDFVIIDEGEKPQVAFAFARLAGGLMLFAFLFWRVLSKLRTRSSPASIETAVR